MGSSQAPGRRTRPLAPKIFVPPFPVRLRLRNQAAPLFTMCGTLQRVSVLLMTVGLPQRPTTGGNGGRLLGVALRPSRALSSAVSSPQM